MTSIADLLADLLDRGIRLRVDDGRLLSDAPKGALTPELIAQIRERKPEIVAFLSAADDSPAGALPPIPRIDRSAPLTLSYAQQRAWFLEQIQPGCPLHNLPGGWKLHGRLDVRALRAAFTEMIARHEVLRQRYGVRDGQPVLRIAPPHEADVPLVDLRDVAADEQHAELLRRIAIEVHTPIDLDGRGQLFRTILYKLSDDEHAVFVMPHHIIWDAWSFDLMLHEVSTLYGAFSKGQPSPLPALPTQYTDYAAWERQLLAGDALAGDLDYWRGQLGGELPVLDLATDFPRPDAVTYEGTSEVVPLSDELVERMRQLGSRVGATPYMVTLAAVSLVLSRYGSADDVIIGCPIENSMRPEIEPLIGYFVNMLPMRMRIDHDASFADLVTAARGTALDAFDHQRVPFEHLVEQLAVPRDTSRNPVFQALLLYQDASGRPETVGDLRLEQFNVPMGASQGDVFFWIKSAREGWLLGVDYSTDLFRASTARRMLRHLRQLLDVATESPSLPLRQLDMLAPVEREDLVYARNATTAPVPREALVHRMIEDTVDRTPDKVAVIAGDDSLSYAQLDRRANQLAHKLRGLGVERGHLVGVHMERTANLLVALLGIFKAGAAYLPLDPEFPDERLDYMRADSGAEVVLDDDAFDDLDDYPDERAAPVGHEADLAYMIYTSGSTGRPKGVELMHKNAVNLLCAMARRPGLSADDVLVAVTTLSFDISVLELFLPLTVGAQVVVASADEAADGDDLLELVERTGATVMQATPATWRMLLDAGWQGDAKLKALCGGEALPVDLARTLAGCCGELWNMYGPTETTVWSTCARIGADVGSIRIGTPIANTEVYVLDRHGNPTTPGVPGELYIGGRGVARGYHNLPELTAQRFVDDEFSGRGGALYRTGDLARWHTDGTLECLGRLDNQVKVRGFRIELGEIETALVDHEAIDQAVVGVSQAGSDDARLAAYVIYTAGASLTVSEVRRLLRQRLPDYMIPGLVVEMDRFPLTPNGKVDRKALPDPLVTSARRSREFVAPSTPAEQLISDVWRDLLGVEQVGSSDNFYEIGGHSLLSLRAVVEIEKRSGQRLDPRAMFFQTVEQLAHGLDAGAD